ncbi:LuxR C-terminal-related transcriptional regulator [Zavarzinia compransoris]|uniref:LuxR family transcriptional regulator n=1 Tax=Zavarzinia compransoris TaxID=1264899 RepID=A0A317DWT7_9PROT|nr:LuxR C-terminal-related transcriptional regulator [Zavarzinia compransoris]PWR18326.1 LuxR family transcriptional regulator [Zavarzinia compransoris]TDP43615.1 LuxR family transcriptional regulator [Zavarzinia compransoris]
MVGTADTDASLPDSEILLKVMPPRVPRHLLPRSRLSLNSGLLSERAIILVQAPPGFGKTSLLAQWRREALARGAAVAWLSADDNGDPVRFLQSLVLSVRIGCGRPGFGRTLPAGSPPGAGALDGVTSWLAEVAVTPLDLVVIIDEADRLSTAGRAVLGYLLHNAPQNLGLIVAGRAGLDTEVADLIEYGECLPVGQDMLRFRLEETIALVRGRLGSGVDVDACARLHERADGWPLGLQIILADLERSDDPHTALKGLTIGSATLDQHLVDRLLSRLSAEDEAFLVRISVVDHLHPDLCRTLADRDDAPERLARLVRDTPVFLTADDSEWCRLHMLVRSALRERFAALPAAERARLHGRASLWLAARGMVEDAARHAEAAGDHDLSYDLVERSLYDTLMKAGPEAVLEWSRLLPVEELDRRPRLRLAVAWALALGDRHQEANEWVGRILGQPGVDESLRYECDLITSGAAYYADDPEACIAVFQPWIERKPVLPPRLATNHVNRLAMITLFRDGPGAARDVYQTLPVEDRKGAPSTALLWSRLITGLTYVWEGQVRLGEGDLRVALAEAEADLGRRNPLVCMLAALLAVAVYEADQIDEAAALLANRLDILEGAGAPEPMLLAFRTAARIACAQGADYRGLEILDALHRVAVKRHLPRLGIFSLGEQVRIHAGRFRSETCRSLVERIDEILARDDLSKGDVWHRSAIMQRHLARAYAAIAAQKWKEALACLEQAVPPAERARHGRLRIEIMALRAYALDRLGERAGPLLDEALNLAATYGLKRTIVDAHPGLADWARRLTEEAAKAHLSNPAMTIAPTLRPPAPRAQGGPKVVASMVLTPKEREVLELLARALSNKEIAQAMEIGEETVKWHLKNLFGKLDAGTRKQLLHRARILGLLEGAD